LVAKANAGGDGYTAFPPVNSYTEGIMKRLKRIFAVLTLVVAALVVSYLIYTGGNVGA
jgi:hypothetical protein